MSNKEPIALIIGLCSHGIAMARALKKQGVKVYAFESNKSLPGTHTNSAIIHFIDNINSDGLIEDLLTFRKNIALDIPIALFPTNDNNVRILGENIDEIRKHFLLSWQGCSEQVLSLLNKSNIETRCKKVNIRYPSSTVINSISDLEKTDEIEFPVLIKPVTPQSSFKALKCDSPNELLDYIRRFSTDLPILMQPWISGTDKDLYFGVLYIDKGQVVSEMVGNKVESFPPAMGQTTVAVTCDNEEVLAITKTFFDGLSMSGPVSLELKKDNLGRYWVIEPTVGRTDFWFDLCVKAGLNLLYIEYLHCIKRPLPPTKRIYPTIWFDSEKDILACFRNIKFMLPFGNKRYSPTFSYLDKSDPLPFLAAFRTLMIKVKRRFSKTNAIENNNNEKYRLYNDLNDMPEDAKSLLSPSQNSPFLSQPWYENFALEVASESGSIKYLVIFNNEEAAIALIPLWYKNDRKWLFKRKWITSLTNYYSPLYDINWDPQKTSYSSVITIFVDYLLTEKAHWDMIEISPIVEKRKNELVKSFGKSKKLAAFPYLASKNLYEPHIENFSSYMDDRPSRLKNTLKRKTKKLSREHKCETEILTSRQDIKEGIKRYHQVYNKSWKVNEPYPDFVTGLAKVGASQGWSRLGILTIEDTPVAAQLWLVSDSTAYIYKLAYDKSFNEFSPGTILTEKIAKHVIENDSVTAIDFLTGDDKYKQDWMSECQPLYGIQICNINSFFGLLHTLKNSLSSIKSKWNSH